MAEIKMAPPWIQYVNALNAMFKKDAEVEIRYDDDEKAIKLFVQDGRKADALAQLLPETKEFGNVTLKIVVIPANNEKNYLSLFRDAFFNNEAVSDIWTTKDVYMSNTVTYIIFKKEVVQYYNDNLGDAHGNRTTLYQDIAKELFEKHDGIFFCTDNK